MKITEHKIPVREIFNGYVDDEAQGCFVYSGKCCARPGYQRSFVYKDKQRDAVIDTVRRDLMLGIMYWMQNPNGTLEIMDGQQRTLSLCQYIAGDFSINFQYFFNLSPAEQDQILDYELLIYICEGTDAERLDWFKTVNIAGEHLSDQELRNAVYAGTWTADAKKYFSKPGGPAAQIGDKYLNGTPIRQEFLETALKWICDRDDIQIEDYMALHQHDKDANELWMYFQEVIDWVNRIFPEYRKKLMKGLPWGIFYNQYAKTSYNPMDLESQIRELELDEDVTNPKGIYEFLLSGREKERALNIRGFSEKDKMRKYKEQGCICAKCKQPFAYEEMDGDHILPWAKGGHTTYDNLQMLCIPCNRSGK